MTIPAEGIARLLDLPDEDGAAYHQTFGDLRDVYLEDSWVLDVSARARSIRFKLDAVLTPDHTRYSPPGPSEQHCYRKATLTIASDDPIQFEPSDSPAAHDATGEADYGSIDTFVPVDWAGHPAWQLSGEWGTVLVRRPTVALAFDA